MKFNNLLLLVFSSIVCSAQGQDKIWVMGYDCCVSNWHGMNWNFNSGSLVIDTVTRYMNFCETNGEISDANGNLLFYTNGVYVANAQDDTMLNGSGLNPADFTTSHAPYGLTLPQGNLVIPFPGDSTKYYLFHETINDRFSSYAFFYLYFSIIDMSLDSGRGGVIQKNTVLFNDSLVPVRITVVPFYSCA